MEQELAYSFHLGSDKNKRYRFKMVDVYNEQVKELMKIVPDFKIANATIHFGETSPPYVHCGCSSNTKL